MSSSDNSARPVREEDAFDVDALTAWLAERGEGPVTEVQQFRGGASNLTYLVSTGSTDGAGERDLILRRPPSGKKAAGAHDMGREHGIQAALAPVFPYVATMIGHEPDESVLGSEFYVMEKVPGQILRQDLPEPVAPEVADALCQRVLDVLVALHSVDVSAVPELAALGKGEGYVGRQVRGWIRRLDGSRTDDTGDWSDVLAWIEEHQPADVGQVLIHNDYRLDNIVLDDDLGLTGDEGVGVRIVRIGADAPLEWIARNGGVSGEVVVSKVRESGEGYNAATGEYGDLLAQGILDPVKVTRSALANAASITAMLLTTETLVADKPADDEGDAHAGHSH